MLIVHVQVRVKPECVESFRKASLENARHSVQETGHYQTWRDQVAPMMAEPRTSVKFSNVFPDDAGW